MLQLKRGCSLFINLRPMWVNIQLIAKRYYTFKNCWLTFFSVCCLVSAVFFFFYHFKEALIDIFLTIYNLLTSAIRSLVPSFSWRLFLHSKSSSIEQKSSKKQLYATWHMTMSMLKSWNTLAMFELYLHAAAAVLLSSPCSLISVLCGDGDG